MRGFNIVALTDHGRSVLLKTIEENQRVMSKQPWIQRVQFSKIWKIITGQDFQEWIQNPDSVRIVKIHLEDITAEIDHAMQVNGAEKDLDYRIEVTDE